jgi:hypothetical protein
MEWRKCVSIDGHEVSEYGHLKRIIELDNHSSRYPSGHVYAHGLAGKGYPFYNVKVGDKRKNFYAHKLVAEAFIGEQPIDTEVAHNDGEKMNCHYSNLRYATAKENNADKVKHGTQTFGDTHFNTKLKSKHADSVLALRKVGLSQADIANQFDVSQTAVGKFLRRITRQSLTTI